MDDKSNGGVMGMTVAEQHDLIMERLSKILGRAISGDKRYIIADEKYHQLAIKWLRKNMGAHYG
mgnify:CR=1 FL=1